MSPRLLYLHGFGSGPESTKGRALEAHLAPRGVGFERLDLRLPSLAHLRLSAGIAATRAAIGGEHERVVLIGSSLGGLTAARVAEQDPRVCGLVLLAPAFGLARRWRADEPTRVAAWARDGWLEVTDHTTGLPARVDHGFLLDLDATDVGDPDVRVPTLLLHGRADTVVPLAGSRRWAEGRRHVHVIELEDGHELTASIPRICAALDTFLQPWGAGWPSR